MPARTELEISTKPIPSSRKKIVRDVTALTNHFEFWPAWTIHVPMYLMGFYQGIRLGNLNYFPAVNPEMANGGLFNYSKFNSMKAFSEENVPKSILSKPPHSLEFLLEKTDQMGITFPLIMKPDIGERGRGVRLISDQSAMADYLKVFSKEAVIVQEFISKKEEYGVFMIKNPKTGKISIPSITQKIPLQVLGNGFDTVRILVQNHPRGKKYLKEIPEESLAIIPEQNSILQLSMKGNHCKGATFLDRSDLINEEVVAAFEKICAPFPAFFYGRLDVKVDSSDELTAASKVSILEVNGANSEPIHIYSAGNSYFRSLGIIRDFFEEMASIARFNLKSLNPKPKISTLKSSYFSYQLLKKNTHE